jgi:Tfp pilus assembly protein PilF
VDDAELKLDADSNEEDTVTLAALLLAAALAPQEPVAAETSTAEPAPTPVMATEAVPTEGSKDHVDAGLKAFKRRRFKAAKAEFQKAVDAEPQSAAATFYLAYTYYKISEPSRRLTADKKRAAELFAKAYELDPAFRPVWGG